MVAGVNWCEKAFDDELYKSFFLNTTYPELLLNLYISFEIFIRRENEKNPYENHPC